MMERKQFIELCQCASIKSADTLIFHKINWNDDELVEYNGTKYYPVGYILKFDKQGKPIHLAKLHCLKANAVTVTSLDKVNIIKNM